MSSALVCVSGGVDSTAALFRCVRLFSSVRAVYVDTAGKGAPDPAAQSCSRLGIELIVVPAGDVFTERVVAPSVHMLKEGLTPNPCSICNARVKLLLPHGILQGDEKLVTGHYARFSEGILSRGVDRGKDQTYFLSMVPRKILERCFFPLADSLKSEVRDEVERSRLPYLRKESQDLCFPLFVDGIPGAIVNTDGQEVARHSGIGGFTPGQRKGVGAHGDRKFVIRLDSVTNTVVIGNENDLYRKNCILNSINWLDEPENMPVRCSVQTRYRKPAVPAEVFPLDDPERVLVIFDEPQKTLAPGQIGAMYRGIDVIGGGVITDH